MPEANNGRLLSPIIQTMPQVEIEYESINSDLSEIKLDDLAENIKTLKAADTFGI